MNENKPADTNPTTSANPTAASQKSSSIMILILVIIITLLIGLLGGFLISQSFFKNNNSSNNTSNSTPTPTQTSTPTQTVTASATKTPTATPTTTAPQNYLVTLIDGQSVFSKANLNLSKDDSVTFSLDSKSQSSFFVTVKNSANTTVDSFGLNLEKSATNSDPHNLTFGNSGTFTVTAQYCLNTQCLSGSGSNLGSMQIIVK